MRIGFGSQKEEYFGLDYFYFEDCLNQTRIAVVSELFSRSSYSIFDYPHLGLLKFI